MATRVVAIDPQRLSLLEQGCPKIYFLDSPAMMAG